MVHELHQVDTSALEVKLVRLGVLKTPIACLSLSRSLSRSPASAETGSKVRKILMTSADSVVKDVNVCAITDSPF